MDPLTALLHGPRAQGAFLLRSTLDPPWSLRIQDRAPLTLLTVVRGEAVVAHDGAAPLRLGAGDTALVRGPAPWTVADDPATPTQAVVHPGQRCTDAAGEDLPGMAHLGTRTWGNAADGRTVLLSGTYQGDGEVSRLLLDALPTVVVVPGSSWGNPLAGVLAAEVVRDGPGQDAVLDRLLDLLLITALRAWFSRPDAAAPGWYRAHGDPVVGQALRLLQHAPARPWRLDSLAQAAGVSRATLSRRFTRLVGEPPMTYLTGLRLALAADLIVDPDHTVASVARAVGYSTPFALSTAFTRNRGISPDQHRRRVLAGA